MYSIYDMFSVDAVSNTLSGAFKYCSKTIITRGI